MKTIVMVFKGPLQSYGTDSHFEIRHTDSHPSKSAVIGLIAAAMGIRREDRDGLRKLSNLRITTRLDQIGNMTRDYQIARKYKNNGKSSTGKGSIDRTYVTTRYYLEDALFLVALDGEDSLIEEIYDSLQTPYFSLFLGRRSCPVNYDFLVGVYDGAAMDQIRKQDWMAAEWYQKKKKEEFVRLDVYADAECIPEVSDQRLRRDMPITFSQMGRRSDLRFEAHTYVDVKNKNLSLTETETSHDVFSVLDEG